MKCRPTAEVEYKRGDNNDKAKKIFIGMLWGGKAFDTLSPDEYAQAVSTVI